MGLDDSKKIFDTLLKEWSENIDNIVTEEDARFQVIDRMLTEVLGWNHSEIRTERNTGSGYVDYLIYSGGRNRLVLEAKRMSKLLIDTINPKVGEYKVNGAALDSAIDGLKQAKRYCIDTGTGFAVLTTGIEWIGFLAVRTDGTSPKEGKAIVFPNLQSIQAKFAKFYDLFSRESVLNEDYKIVIHQAEGLQIQSVVELYTIVDSAQIRLLNKTKIASDLDQIFREFFSSMSGEHDIEMLSRCFVETKESREADSSLEKITRKLLNKIEVVSHGKDNELQKHIKQAVETQRGDFVLIIGNKGAGKSTFIDRFFRLILEKSIRDKCLVLRVDLRDSTGDIETITEWIIKELKDEIEGQLFKQESPTYEELQGIFYKEYERWKKGEYKYLYEHDKKEFKIKFGEYIYNLSKDSPLEYVIRLLQDSVRSRLMMPCLIFDNADHYPQQFQDAVFQFAQSIFRKVITFVIFPITDRTIWQLSKSGPFQSYDTTKFYLPVPSTKDVLSKRVDFVKHKIEESNRREEYFLKKGIKLNLQDINAFAVCLEEVFVKTDFVGRIIGWLANFDIRRSLQITQRIITSPRISIDDLVKTFLAGNSLMIPEWDIMRALISGDYTYFNQEENDFILNMFSIKRDRVTSPLIKLSIIVLLQNRELSATTSELSYMSVEDVMNYLEPLGFSRTVVKHYMLTLLQHRLIEPYDPTEDIIYEDLRVKVTSAGKIHYELATNNETYVTQMALTTPIRDNLLITKQREIFSTQKLNRGHWLRLISNFIKYVLEEDAKFVSIPDRDMYEIQLNLRTELEYQWRKKIQVWDLE